MNKKKVDSILKGVTAAGIAIGGVSTIQGADMVMAQEIENQVNDQTSQSAGSMSDSMSDTPSESRSESETNQASENQTETASEETSASQTESTSEQNANSTSVEETEATSETETASQQMKESPRRAMAFNAAANNVAASLENGTQVANNEENQADENGNQTLEEASLSASMSASTEDSVLLSGSTSASELESVANSASAQEMLVQESVSNSESMAYSLSLSVLQSEQLVQSESLSVAESVYNSTSNDFHENKHEDEYLESLRVKINAQQKKVNNILESARKTSTTYDLHKCGFFTEANKLADLIIQYRFYQNDGVKTITHSSWTDNKSTNNYVKVDYKDQNGKDQTAYFDYVLIDANGVTTYNQDGSEKKDGSSTHAGKVYGIAVLQKTYDYTEYKWFSEAVIHFKDSGNKLTYKGEDGRNYNGNFKTKGDYIYSSIEYERGKDDYSTKRSELTSASARKSQIESLSESLSTHISEKF